MQHQVIRRWALPPSAIERGHGHDTREHTGANVAGVGSLTVRLTRGLVSLACGRRA
jgi:hypothetical protein